jgi:Poly(3-hydroxybutyrate) depolymerase
MTKFNFHFACIALMATALLSCSDDASSPTPNGPEILPPSSSSETMQPVSSSSVESSSTQVSHNSFPVYEFKNAPTPSKGCGKTYTLDNEVDYINGSTKRYNITSAGQKRTFYMDLPDNYDNTKPYKILFANHFMGASAKEIAITENSVTFFSPYYGQKELDTENNYIFVAPQGENDGTWCHSDNRDHIFFADLLTLLEENLCIDTSRVFVTGFSFGAMFSNSLAQEFQHRIRAVVAYSVADYNIYIPENVGKPIAWMEVHGIRDVMCPYDRLDNAITRILKHNGPEDGNGNFTDVSDEIGVMERYTEDMGKTHVCYDFKKVDPHFPVRVCTWDGTHDWLASDNSRWQDSWVPKDVHKFIEQF